MPRKPIQRSNEHYYHITARSNNKDYFYLHPTITWEIIIEQLAELQDLYKIKIAAFVLMNNHFHLLVLTPNDPIDRIMYFLMKGVTKEMQKKSGRINKIFGGRYKGSLITNHEHLMNAYKYIYRNPISAGIIEKAEDYPYSTLFYQHLPSETLKFPFKIEPILPTHFFNGHLQELKWINKRVSKTEADSIGIGLKKSIFAYEKDRNTHRPIIPGLPNKRINA